VDAVGAAFLGHVGEEFVHQIIVGVADQGRAFPHLGDETDLAVARRLAPEVGIYVVPDSVGWARNPPEQTRASVWSMMEAAASGPLAFQFVMEAGLPPATIDAVLGAVREYNLLR
jgi:hypothetical protein